MAAAGRPAASRTDRAGRTARAAADNPSLRGCGAPRAGADAPRPAARRDSVRRAADNSRPAGERPPAPPAPAGRSEEHTSELQSLMRNSYAVFCLKKKKKNRHNLTLNKP